MWNFNTYRHNVALADENGRQITYAMLEELQKKYGSYMENKRALTFLAGDVSIESIVIYISCIQNRIPVMVLDHRLRQEILTGLVDSYRPRFIWYFGDNEGFDGYQLLKCFDNYRLYCNDNVNIAVNEQLALLLLTSGSTGSRKSVRISYKNIQANMYSIAKSLALLRTDAAMVMLPICYSYGLSVVNSNLFAGATLLVPKSPFFSAKFWEFFNVCNCTSICGVPYTYEVLRKLKFHEKTLPTLRLITQAGGALRREEQEYLLEYAQNRKIDVAIMYGQTEATARISCYFLNQHREKMGCAGKVIPNGAIRIEHKDNFGKGEIVYMGENVTLGYAESFADLLQGDNNKGILYTGDIGYMDRDGFLYITGRKNRIAKVLGVRTSLDELQELLSQRCGTDILCVEEDEKIFAYVANKDYVEAVYNAITYIGMDTRIFRVIYIKEFPKEENGKISYRKLVQLSKTEQIKERNHYYE